MNPRAEPVLFSIIAVLVSTVMLDGLGEMLFAPLPFAVRAPVVAVTATDPGGTGAINPSRLVPALRG